MIYKLVFIVFFLAVGVRNADWDYKNDSTWGGTCSSGTQQSPINLVADDTVLEQIFDQFKFHNYDIPYEATAINNGHTVKITLAAGDSPIKISGGGLIGNYILDSLHFHWESEHTVDGKQFPLEMHLVHYSERYDNTASANAEGLAVLGVFFERSIDDDEDFMPLIEVMQNITQTPNVPTKLERNLQARSFIPRVTGDYYRYMGSLTTPTCNEGVIWTVFDKTLPLSASQIRNFEAVWGVDGPLVLTYRSIQPLNDRVISIRNIKLSGWPPSLDLQINTAIER
ncbi:Eukaryotic-type carbonic anhydrase [Popillia japonica]|uniref:Carbonic anhydrase n=1 Tax=Popillia japonica TaxID=7064 RepID=A0AAW1JHV7_POPJA